VSHRRTGLRHRFAALTPPAGGVVLCGVLAVALLLGGCARHAPTGTAGEPGGVIAIPAVQGSGPSSPLLGQQVTLQGVVTAPLRGLGGFVLQDPRGDGDAGTADAVFVAWDQADAMPRAGQRVRVAGRVTEPDHGNGATTLVAEQVAVLGEAALPPALALPGPPPDWEALEGMRVRIDAPLSITGNHGLARYGELQATFGERLWQPTELHPPGAAAAALAARDARRLLVLDDAQLRTYPDRLWPLPEPLSAAAPLRAGSRVQGVEGVVDQRFGSHRLQLTAPLGRVSQAPRPAAPVVPGRFRLATFNVLNLFNGDGHGGGFPTTRGADSPAEYARQRDKLVAALRALDADILALLEIENDGSGPDSSLAALARALEAAQPGSRWQAVDPPAPGSDAIQVALLYRADRVRAVGRPAQLASGPFAWGSRPPLAQAFALGDAPPLVVAVNHFKSKGGCGEARGADADQGDGQACWNASRVAAAEALAGWLADDPTGAGSARTLLVGDLNAYAMEDPLRRLRALGYVDLLEQPGGYSYVYAGRAGRLDHALATPAAAALVAGAAVWHANADESEAFDYALEPRGAADRYRPDPYRSSDHDPLLIGLLR
jgi:hypothetical protein